MPIDVIHYEHGGTSAWGVVRRGRITPIPGDFATTGDFLRGTDRTALGRLSGPDLDLAEVRLLPPVTQNQQFICQGANYRTHMLESGMDPDAKTFNMIFRKASSCITAADGDLIRPAHVTCLDYEIELGLVVARDVTEPTRITDGNLSDFVAGITIVNDYSARDVQLPQTQFYKGKSYRTFGPVGPYLVLLSREEMHYLSALDLHLTVNGQVRQRGSTSDLVYGPAETLTELSGLQDLFAGDLVATGTPAGCALRVPPPAVQKMGALLPDAMRWNLFLKSQRRRPEYLKPGDVVEARIKSADGVVDLGVQRNRVVEAPPP